MIQLDRGGGVVVGRDCEVEGPASGSGKAPASRNLGTLKWNFGIDRSSR